MFTQKLLSVLFLFYFILFFPIVHSMVRVAGCSPWKGWFIFLIIYMFSNFVNVESQFSYLSNFWFYQVLVTSLLVLFLVLVKIFFSTKFSKSFTFLILLLSVMILFNSLLIFSNNILFILSTLIYLSFYSVYLVIIGYGCGFSVLIIVSFKIIADISLIICFGFSIFYSCSSDIRIIGFLFKLNKIILFMSCLSLCIYSLVGVFGFWINWAMEASYFISCYLHSCGFIALGVLLFSRLSNLGIFKDLNIFLYLVSLLSLISFLVFVYLFINITDMKKSFGFFSASSICYLFLFSIISPSISIIYFSISSIIKVIFFELLSYVSKSNRGFNGGSFLVVLIFFIVNFLGYSFLLYLIKSFDSLLVDVLLFVFHIKLICVLIFTIRLLSWFKFHKVSLWSSYFILLGQVSLFLYFIIFSSLSYHFFFLDNIWILYLLFLIFDLFKNWNSVIEFKVKEYILYSQNFIFNLSIKYLKRLKVYKTLLSKDLFQFLNILFNLGIKEFNPESFIIGFIIIIFFLIILWFCIDTTVILYLLILY